MFDIYGTMVTRVGTQMFVIQMVVVELEIYDKSLHEGRKEFLCRSQNCILIKTCEEVGTRGSIPFLGLLVRKEQLLTDEQSPITDSHVETRYLSRCTVMTASVLPVCLF